MEPRPRLSNKVSIRSLLDTGRYRCCQSIIASSDLHLNSDPHAPGVSLMCAVLEATRSVETQLTLLDHSTKKKRKLGQWSSALLYFSRNSIGHFYMDGQWKHLWGGDSLFSVTIPVSFWSEWESQGQIWVESLSGERRVEAKWDNVVFLPNPVFIYFNSLFIRGPNETSTILWRVLLFFIFLRMLLFWNSAWPNSFTLYFKVVGFYGEGRNN